MPSNDQYVCTLSQKWQEKAERELNETPQKRTVSLRRFRKTIAEFPGLTCRTDDLFLLSFLRARKFDEYRALQLLLNHIRVRQNTPEVFDCFRPSAVKQLLDVGTCNILPGRDGEGRTILWVRGGLWDPEIAPLLEIFKTDMVAVLKRLEDEETQVNGIVFIIDFKAFTMAKALHMTPGVGKNIFGTIQDVMPFRAKGFHFVNEPSVAGLIFSIMKPFMKEKIINRHFFHGTNIKGLHKHFSPDLLPPELGGTMKDWPVKREAWVADLMASEQKYIDMERFELIEDTPGEKGGDLKNDALQGMSGTFRKINLD